MRAASVVGMWLFAAALTAGAGMGQAAGNPPGPAEIPPSSYSERQYVDSRGCVFIRAGIGGVVTWVPQVDRSRAPVCGRVPSLKVVVGVQKPVARRVVVAAPALRVVPQHVYEDRQNTRNVAVPKGYRPVWKDDRLNPHRAERTLAPSLAVAVPAPPKGYRGAWQDGRLNTRRAQGTAAGEAAMGAIWTDELPRRLQPGPPPARVVTATNNARNGRSPYWEPPVVARLSTRSAVDAPPPAKARPTYVRVATYAAAEEARGVAEALARSGLTMRLGKTGAGASVVLAGPYAGPAEAQAALAAVRRAGYRQAAVMR
ncbi:hypothetical protein ACFO5X_21995 [Seohaeicola nanhaiensis]|uniref:SPOR domain-containing protein n=1 Tax=Seohaeicola nanhaiensis TaxID=1387282 RepID=A0ABV9KMG5_9RHOB